MLMSIYNPFDIITDITIFDKTTGKSREVKLTYTKALSGYFGEHYSSIFNFIYDKILNTENTDDKQLSVSFYPEGRMIYLDIHTCMYLPDKIY